MTKFEFLGDLSRLIADLPEDEREQAMEYYEDYFADAGPENEQEIIKDFISPAYIAEQLREASARRQKMSGNAAQTKNTGNSAPQATANVQPASPSVAQPGSQPAPQPVQSVAQPTMQPVTQPVQPTAQPMTQPVQQPMQSAAQPVMQPVQQPMQSAAQPAMQPVTQPVQSAAQPMTQPVQQPVQDLSPEAPVSAAAAASHSESSAMRNPIFQDASENTPEENEALALKKKTKIDVKSINATTSKVDKKLSRAAAKQAAAEEKQYAAELYSGPKKAVLAVLLIITCPISLSILALIIGLFLIAFGIIVACVALGIAALVVSVISLFLCILSLVALHIPNCIFTLGSALLLFSAGIGICYADFKLATRAIPSAYFSVMVLFHNVKAALARFTMK